MRTLARKTQVRRMHERYAMRDMRLAFWLQDWEDAYNVGGMFRVADACGAVELIMTGKTPVPPNPMIGVTSMGAHRKVRFRHFPRHDVAARTLKAEGYSLVAVEIADEAENYREFAFPDQTCLVLGAEGAGLHGNVIKACDAAVFIPMAGKGRSLNVHVAAAIVGFESRLRISQAGEGESP